MSVKVTIGVDNRVVPSGGTEGQVLTKNSNEDYDLKWANGGGGGGSGGLSPAQTTPRPDTENGSIGDQSVTQYALPDHTHPLNVDDTNPPEMNAAVASAGDDNYYARRDHVHQHDSYMDGLVLYPQGNIFDSEGDLPETHKAGRIAFVKIASS